MKVQLWGVRGSLPRPETPDQMKERAQVLLKEFEKSGVKSSDDFLNSLPEQYVSGFGGNTSCVEVFDGEEQLIIDCGSGLKELGMKMMAGPASKGKAKVAILMTHFHWDHLLGLPFFVPIFIPGNEITFYAVHDNFEECIRQMFTKPYFPVDFSWLPSTIKFETLPPRKKVQIQGFDVTSYELDHPDPCWGFRVEKGGKSYAHCVDTEATRVSEAELGEDVHLYRDADLMVFDGQYTLVEVVEKVNWGHAVAGIGLDLAMRERIDKVVFVHHDPYASYDKILRAKEQTQSYFDLRKKENQAANKPSHDVKWEFGYEGMVIEL